ncbi:MAG: hypothetical protein HQM11_17135 [SAR324 cluster bacterium]|nr:hypothetical protein [SAR324 cluster bacterium]
MMARYLKTGWICLLLSLCVSGHVWAEERITSLPAKQYEIESAIHNSLRHYMEPQDYVIKVWLKGKKKTIETFPFKNFSSSTDEVLPGFGTPPSPVTNEDPVAVEGETYWVVEQMRVDLILYKEISPSLATYITEIIPVLSGMNSQRGDVFNFMPIKPKPLESDSPRPLNPDGSAMDGASSSSDQAVATPEPEPTLEQMLIPQTPMEWLQAGVSLLLLLLILFIFWRIIKLQKQQKAAQAAQEKSAVDIRDLVPSPQNAIATIQQARQDLVRRQDEHVQEILLVEENNRLLQEIIKQLVGREDWKQHLIEEMTRDKQSTEAFTRLLAMMGPQTARRLFSEQLGHEAYLDLEQLARDLSFTPQEANSILKDIWTFLFTKKLTLPEKVATDPFGYLLKLSTGQIAFLLKDEPVKIKALVVSRLNSEQATEVIGHFPKDERTQVMLHLGKMEELPLELVSQVAYNLADKVRSLPDSNTVAVNGVNLVIDVLGEVEHGVRQDIINGLRISDQRLSDMVESRCFIFESIPFVPKEVLMEVVRRLPLDDVIIAISGATKEIKEAVILCFPEQNRQAIVSALKAKTPSPDDIREKRRVFAQSMRGMAENNRVDLKEINTAWAQQHDAVPALNFEQQES